jgi:two-component sensor histidine kinase
VSPRILRPLLAAGGWTAAGLLFALPNLSERGWPLLLGTMGQWWCWGLLTPGILAVDRRLPWPDSRLGRRLAAHVPIGLAFTACAVAVVTALRSLLGLASWDALRAGSIASLFLWSSVVYWLIVGATYAYRYHGRLLTAELRVERLERGFSEARLNALRMQLDPHFLFNALNTISAQVEREPRLARQMIEHLGDLLRLSLESRDRSEVPLSAELDFLERYLAIQRIRFGEHLRVDLRIDTETRRAAVPALLLQPLVENAIRHGLSRRTGGGTVTVSAFRAGARLEVRVLDDGVGLPVGWTFEHAGLGLSVTRERLAALDPEGDPPMTVAGRPGGGTEVALSLPFRLSEEEAHDDAFARVPARAGRR